LKDAHLSIVEERQVFVQPKVYSVSDHDIHPDLVDPDALYILNKLREAGFTAYLVGGSVRDLLLKRTPKDFDISTSALPEQIKQLFQRRCLLIGRRFRLAHVRFGHKIFEISTFRSGEEDGDLIVHDNQWGTPEQDVLRRDFTINGLFYDPATHSVIDYVGGWADIHSNTLRTIGNPEVRFKQDPVRMIRLLKFRARFGFHITPDCRKALFSCRDEILKSSQARILEEILRMLESGAAGPFFSLLAESGMLNLLYPHLADFLKTPHGKEIFMFLAAADKLNQNSGKRTLDRPILMSCLLFPIIQHELRVQFLNENRTPHFGDIIMLTSSAIKQFIFGSFTQFPRRLTAIMNSILSMQYRLTPLTPKKHHSLKVFRYKEFVEALTFLKLRALVDKNLIETYTEWKSLHRQNHRQKERKGHHHPPPLHNHGQHADARNSQHAV
jgi:poly(A) polymerase